MKLATLFTFVMMAAGTANALAGDVDYAHDPNYEQDVQFYLSRMQYSSLPDPADAGAADGAYYADLMANNGVKRVNAQLVAAEEIPNPNWQTADKYDALAIRDKWMYKLAFSIGFNEQALIRGMLATGGKPFQPETKPAAQLGRELERWVEQESKGQYKTVAPTPTPGPIQPLADNLSAATEEIRQNIAKEEAEEQKRKQALDKAAREARGDSSPSPRKDVPNVVIGATPAPW